MFSTTLRTDDDLGRFLQEAARQQALSVNAFLTELIARARADAARKRLASDWAAYAQDAVAQDVSYALSAQAELAAEAEARPYRAARRAKQRP